MSNCFLVLDLPLILTIVNFFLEPITLNFLRALGLMKQEGDDVYDYKKALDVELSAKNFTICLPDVNEIDGARSL